MDGIPLVTIRPFEPEDLEECAQLYVRVFAEPPWQEEWSPADARRHLEQTLKTPGFVGLVAHEGDRIVGVVTGVSRCGATGDYFLFDDMFIDHNRRGQGIGRQLMDALKRRLAADGVIALTLFTQATSRAAAFYRGYGFEEDPNLRFMLFGLGG
jgi:aminoglycoside 6'-N-acetyltransferase I